LYMSNPHREECRRRHRVLGHFLAVQAWHRRLDCIVLDRRDLESYLHLERFKKQRVAWLMADLRPWFPFQQAYYNSVAPSSIHSLFLSRSEITPYLPSGVMSTEERISRMPSGAPRTEIYSAITDKLLPSEGKVVSYLALVGAGLKTPQELLTLKA
jgi:hypothetical protein